MYLGQLIEELEKWDRSLVVKIGFGDDWYSDRGDYSKLAFKPKENATVGEMVDLARDARGKTMTGYKGGEYAIDDFTDVMIGEWGVSGEEIGPILLHYMLSTSTPEHRRRIKSTEPR